MSLFLNAQVSETIDDISMPNKSSSSSIVQNVNESTGKLELTMPLFSIRNKRLNYMVDLSYNGTNVFDQAQYVNKYTPTSVLGVGWNLAKNSISCDTKGTGTRADDTYYLNGVELIPTKETINGVSEKIYKCKTYDNKRVLFDELLDRWEVYQENGDRYVYGGNSNAIEVGIKWGNWIGDSNNLTGASNYTLIWNLSKITDQWGNEINFTYNQIQERINAASALSHTEASYLQEISSSSGKITLEYGNKSFDEFYEPHTEISEPDAYQERYERKFLSRIKLFNRAQILSETIDFNYLISGTGQNKKRYLQKIKRTGLIGDDITMPEHEFEYYLTGDFQGGLKKVINPSGGYTEYVYENKTLFTVTDLIENDGAYTTGYCTEATYAGNNYGLKLMTENCITSQGDYRVKLDRYFWNGEKWLRSDFIIPELIRTDQNPSNGGSNSNQKLDNLKVVMGDDFYGLLYFNRGSDIGSLYLFHLNEDGVTWNTLERRNFTLISKDNDDKSEDPVLIKGENFVAVGESRHGKLRTFYWNGNGWNEKLINLGSGEFYYGSSNNFILSLDEDGGPDIITGASHEDNYYIHYLNEEKEWETKSWSAFADPFLWGIEKPSTFYPNNSMAGFVADDNPEVFLRWHENYNLFKVENIVNNHDDRYPFITLNNIFTIHDRGDNGYVNKARRAAAFDGLNWELYNYTGNPYYFGYTQNRMAYLDLISRNHYLNTYNPNTDAWNLLQLTNPDFQTSPSNGQQVAFTNDLLLIGNYAYRLNSDGTLTYIDEYHSYFASGMTETNFNHIYKELDTSNDFANNFYYLYYIDKKSNSTLLQSRLVANSSVVEPNRDAEYFGGRTPFLSSNTLVFPSFNQFKRIIKDDINTVRRDIVVVEIKTNNLVDNTRSTELSYDDFNVSPNDRLTYYGEVTIENKGFGTGNIGKTVNYYDTGVNDIRRAGILLKSEYYNSTNTLLKESINTYTSFSKEYRNFQNNIVGRGFYFRQTDYQEKRYFESGDPLIVETSSVYNSFGQISRNQSITSAGKIERKDVYYGHQQYSFMRDANIFSEPYETVTQLDGLIVDKQRNIWVNDATGTYLKEKWSGSTNNNLRLIRDISYVNDTGDLLEITDYSEIYDSSLNGYDNLYEVASFTNATYNDVINELDVSYDQLQNLSTEDLRTELFKLYDRLPNALISLTLYDDNGRVISEIDQRQEELTYEYDSLGRLIYVFDSNNNVLEKRLYNFGN